MAGGRHARTSATIYEYQPWHITAATSPAGVTGATGVGKVVASSTATTITGGVTTTITLGASNPNIVKGIKLYIFNATGPTSETFIVLAVNGTTLTATAPFANSYSGTSFIGSDDSTLMGNVVINKAGDAACVLTLYNGNPNIAGAVGLPTTYGQPFAILTAPSVAGNYQHQCLLDFGLFYTLAFTTAPDITIMYDDASQPLTQ